MKTLRKRFNERARNIGNNIYSGLGDIATTEVSKKGLVALATVGSLGLLSGCAEMGAAMLNDDDPDNNMLGAIMYTHGTHDQRMEEAREGRSEVNVYTNNAQSPQDITPQGLFTYNKWIDYNNNGIVGTQELEGLNKRTFNLDKEDMNVFLYTPGKAGNVIYRSFNDKKEIVGESVFFYPNVKGHRIGPQTKSRSPPDFMDIVKENGPGNYKITATFEDETEYAVDIKIVK